MPKTIHTATAPNGQIVTRTSANRTYSHVVVGRRCAKTALKNVHAMRGHWVSNFNYYATVEAAKGAVHVTRRNKETDGEFEARVVANRLDNLVRMGGFTDAGLYADHKVAQALAALDEAVDRGDYDKFHVVGWAGRHDLAVKLVGSNSAYYVDLTILEAARTSK